MAEVLGGVAPDARPERRVTKQLAQLVERVRALLMAGQRIELINLAQALGPQLGRPVIERTGLSGLFDLTMEWTPQRALPPEARAILDASPNPDRPSIFTAIQEQLGLRLVSETAPVEVLVIDHVERPSEN